MNARTHIHYIDGMRGLAALYVVFFHIAEGFQTDIPSWLVPVTAFFHHGQAAVDVFIVISGFCLALPLSRLGAAWSAGGIPRFLRRRAHRILPPYYFAFALTMLGLMVSSEGIAFLRGTRNPGWLANFDPVNLLSHLLLVHNWTERWAQALNPPFWSIATEWQIYFVFAFLLAPLVAIRRWAIAYLAGALITIAAILAFGSVGRVLGACPWYVILFTYGAHAALSMGPRAPLHSVRWLGLGAGLLLASAFVAGPPSVMISDLGIGALAAGCILLLSASSTLTHPAPRALRTFLETRPVLFLGAFSYSLYLTHAPLLAKLRIWINALHLDPLPALAATVFINVPLTLLAAYAFYLLCEKPFLNRAPGAPAPDDILKSPHTP